jgi:UDP-N-acetylglucosamine 2-epimerase (non-hydrolysing)
MNKKKIMVVIGTRPEAVKMAPVIRALRKDPAFETIVCLTAQHREMMDQVLEIFDIQADVDLNLMHEDQSLPDLTASILTQMSQVLREQNPDWVLVQGDTTTVMTTALAAFYNQVRVGHIEAGLRSFNKWAPYPEEINRKIAGIIADLHFAPTEGAVRNLLNEGIPAEICHVTGNTVIDALHYAADLPFDIASSALKDVPFGQKWQTAGRHLPRDSAPERGIFRAHSFRLSRSPQPRRAQHRLSDAGRPTQYSAVGSARLSDNGSAA